MKNQEIIFKNNSTSYKIIIGNKIINTLSQQVKTLCPKTKKIALIIDSNVPKRIQLLIKKKIKKYKPAIFTFVAGEKTKNFYFVNKFLNSLISKNFNRSDLLISVGGGITGDVAGFVASIFKRGINFINIPTTLLAQVDSAIGGKTGINSPYGKNLIGSFYQPKLVLCDTIFLKSLSKKDMICGYAEILKHSLIKDVKFFKWLKKNSKGIFLKKSDHLIYAIKKSCQIKTFFATKDTKEKGLRMKLNFGHTFAHAIEVKNNYSKNISHGEAVLSGMILETRLSVFKKICRVKDLKEIENIYKLNGLDYTLKKFSDKRTIVDLIPYFQNDKKNDDEKINFILLKKIGKTTEPNKFKLTNNNLKKCAKYLLNSNF